MHICRVDQALAVRRETAICGITLQYAILRSWPAEATLFFAGPSLTRKLLALAAAFYGVFEEISELTPCFKILRQGSEFKYGRMVTPTGIGLDGRLASQKSPDIRAKENIRHELAQPHNS